MGLSRAANLTRSRNLLHCSASNWRSGRLSGPGEAGVPLSPGPSFPRPIWGSGNDLSGRPILCHSLGSPRLYTGLAVGLPFFASVCVREHFLDSCNRPSIQARIRATFSCGVLDTWPSHIPSLVLEAVSELIKQLGPRKDAPGQPCRHDHIDSHTTLTTKHGGSEVDGFGHRILYPSLLLNQLIIIRFDRCLPSHNQIPRWRLQQPARSAASLPSPRSGMTANHDLDTRVPTRTVSLHNLGSSVKAVNPHHALRTILQQQEV